MFALAITFFVYAAYGEQRRQEELERKAQELERREEQLRNSEAGIRRNNWPPLPAQCCFQPCFYQDINVEIPTEFQRIVRRLYYLWIFYAMVLVSNALTAFFLIFRENSYGLSHFILGLIYGALFTPASFLCWYVMTSKTRIQNLFTHCFLFLLFAHGTGIVQLIKRSAATPVLIL